MALDVVLTLGGWSLEWDRSRLVAVPDRLIAPGWQAERAAWQRTREISAGLR
ncbi:hypothetical protein AB0P21_40835 [Kribbella sp. NPDC056861]|uniref:hypothetical protein n=1 Tax=Kribbella sp. NPDC056861 TaxID=3154857 RepID=UPI00343C4EC8